MKKILYYIAAIAAMISCTEAPVEEMIPEVSDNNKVSVAVSFGESSRVAIGEDWSVAWEQNDTRLNAVCADNSIVTFERSGEWSATEATFSSTTSLDTSFNLLYPYSDMSGVVASIDLTTQEAGAKNNYMISSEMISADTSAPTKANMVHLGSIVELQLSGLDAHNITEISKIEVLGLNSSCKLAAKEPFEGQSSYEKLTASKITIEGNIAAVENGTAKVRFNILPTLLTTGDVVYVRIFSGEDSYYESFTITDPMEFGRGMYNIVECAEMAKISLWSDFAADGLAEAGKISSAEELAWLAKSVNGGDLHEGETFTLTQNIDLSAHEWVAVGCYISDEIDYPFEGIFDGAGFTISGLNIIQEETDCQALFGYIYNATIMNLSVSGAVTGHLYTGGIAGSADGESTIINCYSDVNIKGFDTIGGIAGSSDPDTQITNCHNNGNVVGAETSIGGIAGWSDGTITNCYNTGKASGSSYIGGIAGWSGGTTKFCYWDNTLNESGTGDDFGIESLSGMTPTEMQSEEFRNTLYSNAALYNLTNTTKACGWKWTSGTYPTLDFENKPILKRFSGGDGTAEKPLEISTRADLDLLSSDVNSGVSYNGVFFTLSNNIDLGGTAKEFTAIGKNRNVFSGIFDGAGHTISGLYINQPDAEYQALFGIIDGATIKNLSVAGEVIGKYHIAGIVGSNNNSTVINCCYTGKVQGDGNTGGIVGDNYSTVVNCYSISEVKGGAYTGGIIGYNKTNSIVINCYASSSTHGSYAAGGVVGENQGTVNKCYWNIDIIGFGIGKDISTSDITGKTTAEMGSDEFTTELNTNAKEIDGACAWSTTTSGFPQLLFGVDPSSDL